MAICYSNTSNVDPETGYRYGIIRSHLINTDCLGEFQQPEFEPMCPDCNVETKEDENGFQYCPNCGAEFEDNEELYAYSENYDGPLYYRDDQYDLMLDEYGDIWVFKSPYVALGSHASPCAPGAVTLPGGEDDYGYCLGQEWFDGEVPYKVEAV